MRVAVPHNLPKEEVRRRMSERIPELQNHLPGGVANVHHSWKDEDTMNLSVQAMGQQVGGTIEVAEGQLIVDMDVPPALSFFKPLIERGIRDRGQKLLGPT
ncbi:hypothetical protein HME9302_01836 [Alteripontixanthobacter maritimus]|uniref:Polyhydroxyalkanoic acid system protein n=1 Tax=Alteripontixanthobacter maritimus TaxID=2161824 RepID=A0A369Q833_9SPHN|nr:polyhydroxyalkanoic acid system family protein [Alteripontixanthobacter maritimus]RDC60622.1 hypothetical protein HME9302_01836 [Alteripontixanthobacter maritimus]